MAFLQCGGLIVYSGRLGVISDSQATNRSVEGGRGLSQGVSLLPISRLEVIYDSQSHGYTLLIAIRIRGKGFKAASAATSEVLKVILPKCKFNPDGYKKGRSRAAGSHI
jgi:hypothetical protein